MSANTALLLEEVDTFNQQSLNPSDYLPIPVTPDSDTENETQLSINNEKFVLRIPNEKVVSRFIPDASWEGIVLDIFGDSFEARLTDINDPSICEEAEILNTSVTDQDDLELIKPGAIFFWSIGSRIEGRRREKVSLIQFRRLPVWTDKEIQRSKEEATEIYKSLGW